MSDEQDIRDLYRRLLAAWDSRNAAGIAALIAPHGNMVGFDGSPLDGPAAIAAALGQIFALHPTPPFIGIVREVRMLSPDTAMLRAVAGMVVPGINDINPAVNAIQTLVSARHGGVWMVEMFQNTPAAFHGRPDEVEKLTAELRAAMKAKK